MPGWASRSRPTIQARFSASLYVGMTITTRPRPCSSSGRSRGLLVGTGAARGRRRRRPGAAEDPPTIAEQRDSEGQNGQRPASRPTQ